MGIVSTRKRRSPAARKGPKITGTCKICGKRTMNALVVKGKTYTDQNGDRKRAADTLYHRECYSMQRRGLLNAGTDKPKQNSTGKPCGGCNQTIDADDNYAHRKGVPYHRECLL